jgi:hypothetical protein
MRRLLVAFTLSLLALGTVAVPTAARCPTCDGSVSVSVQTPDGKPWSDGKPVTVVVSARRDVAASEFPATALAVVMRTDGDRTKCLDVPMRLVNTGGDGATYAGVFYPFRAAAYDGKLSLGDSTFDIRFDVRTLAATTPVATPQDLPIGSTEEPYTILDTLPLVPILGAGLALWLGIAALRTRRTRRAALPALAS